jgi:hypothetical protein
MSNKEKDQSKKEFELMLEEFKKFLQANALDPDMFTEKQYKQAILDSAFQTFEVYLANAMNLNPQQGGQPQQQKPGGPNGQIQNNQKNNQQILVPERVGNEKKEDVDKVIKMDNYKDKNNPQS